MTEGIQKKKNCSQTNTSSPGPGPAVRHVHLVQEEQKGQPKVHHTVITVLMGWTPGPTGDSGTCGARGRSEPTRHLPALRCKQQRELTRDLAFRYESTTWKMESKRSAEPHEP